MAGEEEEEGHRHGEKEKFENV